MTLGHNPNKDTAIPDEEFITKGEIAKRLHVTTRTIDSWREKRLISSYKIASQVRFLWSEVCLDVARGKEGI
jgi:hypothetical protein